MFKPSSRSAKAAGLVSAVTLALAIGGLAPAQAATTDPQPAAQAGNWIAGQLTNGLFNGTCASDCGQDIDAGTALLNVGGHTADVSAIAQGVATHINGYITGESFGDSGSFYASPAAKALAFVEASGGDKNNVGGVDLLGKLESSVAAAAPIEGRIRDTSQYGDNANAIGQYFAAGALSAAGSAKAPSVVNYALLQQCAAGYFRTYFTFDQTSSDQSCDAGGDNLDYTTYPPVVTNVGVASDPSPDSTALAIIEMSQITGNAALTAALARAKAWLAGQQLPSGAWGGSGTESAPNANNTGLAIAALGDTPATRKGSVWLRQHQARDAMPCATKLAADQGAVAYDDAGYSAGKTSGVAAAKTQWRMATIQSAPALRLLPAAAGPLSIAGANTKYVRAGSKHALSVTNIAPGSVGCLSLTRTPKQSWVADATNRQVRTITLPGGTGTRTYRVSDSQGRSGGITFKALAAKRFNVRVGTARVKRGRVETVRATGLARYEAFRVFYRGKIVASGSASVTGVVTAKFKVGFAVQNRLVTVAGAFAESRSGKAAFRVVR